MENVLTRNDEESFDKFLCPDAGADDFQNVISFSLFTTHLLQNFYQDTISSFYVKLQTDKKTDNQLAEIT